MLFFCRVGIFHLPEHLAGKLGAIAAVLIIPGIHRAVVERTNLGWHHLFRPECRTFNIYASGACCVIKFTLIAF